MIATSFYSFFRNGVLAKITDRFVNSKSFFNTELEKILENFTKETSQKILPIMEDICGQREYLDFTDSSKKGEEDKLDAYYCCMDYCIDILTILIEHTLQSAMLNSEFNMLLCKRVCVSVHNLCSVHMF